MSERYRGVDQEEKKRKWLKYGAIAAIAFLGLAWIT